MTAQSTNLYLLLILTFLSMSITLSTLFSFKRERFQDWEDYPLSSSFEREINIGEAGQVPHF